ncbi:MAG TPA: aromatic aminobenezylarsenical efflux permease ArsG family transporter [bacterium]|nr:aromatic aminobenezylarsenical efflux permease ArsG family transporter [bacterium]
MDFINFIIDSSDLPILIAFFLGVLMSISPCPLATNITAIAYISKRTNRIKIVLLDGLFYTLGRLISYTSIATLIYFGLSSFQIGKFFQSWGNKILGPILILIALTMLGVIKINIKLGKNNFLDVIKEKFSKKGYLGALLLGILFSLAFCPYSGILFFAILIPMILTSSSGLLLAPVFAIGSGVPVIIFSFIIAFSIKKLSKSFNAVKKIERIVRQIVSFIFLGAGLYYSYFLIIFIINKFI